MTRRPTQIYLTPEQHRVLRETARAEGRSMADIIRELVERHLMPAGPPPTDLRDLVGAVRSGRRTDVAANRDSMVADALRGLR